MENTSLVGIQEALDEFVDKIRTADFCRSGDPDESWIVVSDIGAAMDGSYHREPVDGLRNAFIAGDREIKKTMPLHFVAGMASLIRNVTYERFEELVGDAVHDFPYYEVVDDAMADMVLIGFIEVSGIESPESEERWKAWSSGYGVVDMDGGRMVVYPINPNIQ